MNKQSIIIYDFDILFNVLDEIKENLKFQLFKVQNYSELLNINEDKYGNYLILVNSEIYFEINIYIDKNNIFVVNVFPLTINKLIEKLNIQLLKQKYIDQSEIKIKEYILDLNSREITKDKKQLKLTEREIDIILHLHENKRPQSIEIFQKSVWGHTSVLETHTVETHIYRLRKKIKDKFNDENFIISLDNGYKIDE